VLKDNDLSMIAPDELKRVPMFRDFSAAALAGVAALCSVRNYSSGEPVIVHSESSLDAFLVLSGKAQVELYSADGQRVGFHDLAAGEMFGEISAIDGMPRSASVTAAGACRIARIPHRHFLALLETNPSFAVAVAQRLASQVRRLTVRVFEFSTMAVRQRLRGELLRLSVPDEGSEDAAVIDPMPTHSELASRISTHREAVSREMAWLDSKGIVAKRGRSLAIRSRTQLRALLEESWYG
jgi:CRP/FNR family cyclic AMP-dependent transcriptional regulator